MRIGIITAEYPPDQGGVGDFSHELGRALTGLGHETHVITGEGSRASRPPITVHHIDSWGWGCWRQVLTLAATLQLDVLNVQYQTAAYGMHPAIHLVPGRRDRPPVVVTFHDLKAPYLFPKAGPLRWQIVRWLARRADGVIATNQEDWTRLEGEIPRQQLALIPIGSNISPLPPQRYDRDAARARWGAGADSFLLGYFGFLNESKGGEELMRALALLVARGLPVQLVMVGGRVGSSDPTNLAYAERVDGLLADLGIAARVHWTSYARPEEVSAALLATDLCVLPYRDGVSFRRGTLHACLAHGRAVVTTRPVAPLPQVRDGENMLLASPGSSESLADAIARALADPLLRARLEKGAAELAAEFTWERIARQTAAFFGRLI